jgi:DNA-binding SARP family transcriptional activator
MEFRLLGPVEARLNGRILTPRRPQQSAVLAALLVDAGRLVPIDVMIERVWGHAAPPQARRSLYTHVTRIRRLLDQAGDGAAARLDRRSGGYLLNVQPDRVDLHRFVGLLARAREPTCADGERLVLLREAVALWRGPPLAGLTSDWTERMRRGWQRDQLSAMVAWAQAELRAGDPDRAVAPLTALAAEHPLDEPLAAVLMRALYAGGRAAAALDHYARFRRLLIDQLGAEPGVDLQLVHRAILRDQPDPVLGSTRDAPLVDAAAARPAMLPPDLPGFAGRADPLGQLDDILAEARRRPTAGAVALVWGTAGVGKSTLAIHWANRVRARFPDGQLYVNLRGFDPTGDALRPGEVMRDYLAVLGVHPQRVPSGLDGQVGLYRSLLAGRRILVLLDNARDAEQIRPLLPGAAGCFVLVTSRNRLSGLVVADGARPVPLELLDHAEAHDLLARRIGIDRVAAEPEAISEIIVRCARLPLALAVVAARAATNPDFPLAALARDLHDARGGLTAFVDDDAAVDVRAVLSSSYRQLDPAAARLFRLLGAHAGPDIGLAAAASLAGVAPTHARARLARLVGTHLIAEPAPGRFTFHDLLRALAAELAHRYDDEADRRAALHRMLDHYLHSSHAAALLLTPHREPLVLPPPRAGVTIANPADHGQAMAWFTAEEPALLAAVARSARTGSDRHCVALAESVRVFLQRQGHWAQLADVLRAAVAAARRTGDVPGQAGAVRHLGYVNLRRGRPREALNDLRQALDLFVRLADRTGRADTYANLAQVYERLGRPEQALDHIRQALRLYRASGYRPGQALALNGIGWLQTQLGHHAQAVPSCREAIRLHQQVDDPAGEAASWDSLGRAHHHLGGHRAAVTCYRRALDLRRDLGDRYGEANTLNHLGDTFLAAGDPDAARGEWRTAAEILTALDHPDADEVSAKLACLDRHRGAAAGVTTSPA